MPAHMKTLDEYSKHAKDGRAFSNATEWEIWQYNVCHGRDNPGRRCIQDDNENDPCPLLSMAIAHRVPAEWKSSDPQRPHRYNCSEHLTQAESDRRAAQAQRTEIADMHYSMFETED